MRRKSMNMMRIWPGLVAVMILIMPQPGRAQDDSEDPFAAFDDAFGDEFDVGFEDEKQRLIWSGFVEGAYGRRLHRDANQDSRQTLGDLRARLETDWSGSTIRRSFKGDALYDDYESDFETEFRELSLQLSPAHSVDLKVGRQVLTWGTGDLLFLNDLFPKSWVNFFSGRDDEYLKAPSDAVRLTWFTDAINVDFAWSPEFDSDDYLTGSRFSFFSPISGRVVAPRPTLSALAPESDFENGEFALRLYKTHQSTEYAAYFYRGFSKQPLGLTDAFEPTFPALSVYGASLRRPLGAGLFNAEFAFHDSRQDPRGTNPLIPNDQLRLLLGYEFEARARFTVSFQYYLESTRHYTQLLANSPTPQFEPERNRSVLTNRLTYRSALDELTLSLFTFVAPGDDDFYIRPSIAYRSSDRLTMTAGANVFSGQRVHTFFGQLEDASNAWVRVRYNF